MRKLSLLVAVASVVLAAGCTSSTETNGAPVERTYAVYAINGESPDGRIYYDVSGNRISVPRGTLKLHKDGTVEETLQYALYFNNGVLNFTDTVAVAGRYEWNQGRYEISMPTLTGTVLYSGAMDPSSDFVALNRSWLANSIPVKLTITYSRE